MKKLKSKFNQLKTNVKEAIKEAVKKKILVDQEDNIEVTNEVLITKKVTNQLLKYENVSKEKEYWRGKYNSLLSDLQAAKRIDKQIKSRL